MHIKEFPRVLQDGKELIEGTNTHALIGNFVEQMYDRGFTSFTFFTDKYKEEMEFDPEMALEDTPSGLSYTEDFHHEDMMSMVLGYMNSCMDTTSKLAFATQLHNFILSEVIDESSGGYAGYEDDELI